MKLDSSSDTDSSSENTYSSSAENSDNVTLYSWQIVEKKITKSKVDVTLKDAAEMFKDDIKTLKKHIYIERSSLINCWYILHLKFLSLWQNLFRQLTLYTYLETKILSSQKI